MKQSYKHMNAPMESFLKGSRQMKRYADIHRRLLEFGIGDQVMLKLMSQITRRSIV